MGKRTWSETQISTSPGPSSRDAVAPPQRQSAPRSRDVSQDAEVTQQAASLPQISRKVKACAACRKQKIKCLMDERGPPCRRCTERGLGCVLNKSLQTLIDEKSQFTDAYSHDLDMVYSSLQGVLRKIGMPQMPPLQSSSPGTLDEQRSPSLADSPVRRKFNVGPSCDNSPQINPTEAGLSDVPIHSLYALTKLSAFRSPDAGEVEKLPDHSSGQGPDDFISRGAISRESADRLFRLFNDKLDHYMYQIGCPYSTLDELRAKSSILTASICTVAALHDRDSDSIYGICSDEFRRLMGACMFDRLVNRDSLRAMCIAAYWLSDISWTISGYAIRRAGDINLSSSFTRIAAGGTEKDADCLRLWYILYICDQHLAILYGRQPIVRDDFSVKGCERLTEAALSTDQDTRLVSQVSVMRIFEEVRDLFSRVPTGPLPDEYLSRIDEFERQLMDWHNTWTSIIKETYPQVGSFPLKGLVLHLHFSKLHLYSHVFQGLGDSPIPTNLLPYASVAVSSARSIIEMLLLDEEARRGLIGPSYLLSMTGFACMFLIKVAMKYGNTLVDRRDVTHLITQLVDLFRKLPTGKWHLVHLMEGGLEKMLGIMAKCPETSAATPMPSDSFSFGTLVPGQDATALGLDWASDFPVANLDGFNFMDYNIGLSPLLRFDQSTPGFGGPGHGF
ncbi:hypothetical protein CONLIGDRAFT_683589 [Coniochaeta ligniaria NRRL 30616]|uniref:Zn(2)-C6 fungal-type domain-containing protein n=1 Tax=Coniochaeta ligniaria NRRL 30616 TaxID=1408157 RepID=A0A1J7IH91_9PEZI|nr:hypothetical protein CONLIGDRAFT_683589 [Coniochaeta ligniaria NRRL 30616]